ncbi:COG4626 Phage terminase-like protein, large subunit [uncultured Caudovirales phage]|uniref:COG4626 Phage terminase-like protein, large subunit n=3 Tax=uncultured Caudovirales phage TaxID=2100421 RepID=A0A6J7XG60_9CAUD|nr:COG4626 Phage terminase-like protein, large subunit [uncultured Caudovirales phage]CAB4188398.1 COG4626 Phage terminase-like protein, large subunit [uncultured Caudovirales phage]CAB4191119.1 COG4626 Phage terminase-like protein, large subunit [uncultured Caudovirales phage]CAB5230037.1 COG4626 Phage terminase-like protein, large subunit [uncultured Caudovirales phage]
MSTSLPGSLIDCRPRFFTPRTDRPTLGGRVDEIAAALGQPLMPWQRLVVDTALELDDVGRPVYRNVVLTVPRQQGKTTLLLSLLIHRALAWSTPQHVTYAAQTGVAARDKFVNEHVPMIEKSPFSSLMSVRRSNGHEAIEWANGSRHTLTAATEKSGHGSTLDLPVIDEAFAYEDARLEQAFTPAMSTRADAQLWVVSTAGTTKSVYLRAKVDAGRAATTAGTSSDTAYFEWSAPDDHDPADPGTWWGCMPALGHTVTERVVRAAYEQMSSEGNLDEFCRAFLNQWRDGVVVEALINDESWSACYDPVSRLLDPISLGIYVNPDRAFAAIGVAGGRADGLTHVEVAHHDRGTGWVVERVERMAREQYPASIVLDPGTAAGSLIPQLERAGLKLTLTSGADKAKACGSFFDAVTDRSVRHIGQLPLTTAATGATTRPLGDAWAWNRKNPTVDIAPLEAVTLALWGHALHAGSSSEPGLYVI